MYSYASEVNSLFDFSSTNSILTLVFAVLAMVVAILLLYLIADEFYAVAKMKGYNEKKYFWFSFFFGIAGYILVASLPVNTETKTGEQPSSK